MSIHYPVLGFKPTTSCKSLPPETLKICRNWWIRKLRTYFDVRFPIHNNILTLVSVTKSSGIIIIKT